MKTIQLNTSGVTYNESPHTYTTEEGRVLSGITGLIHIVKRLGVYPQASEYVQKYVIPKAGEYGTCVHNAIELYEKIGIKNTHWSMRLGEHEVTNELETYIKLKENGGYSNLRCEYNVAYGGYASNIDNVWVKEGEIYLVDTKTNNLELYPGGKSGLVEYLTWQLNCYRVMFENQNPHLKVKGLLANWIRKEDGETWQIPTLDDELVLELLTTEYDYVPFDDVKFKYYRIENGVKRYYENDTQIEKKKADELPTVMTNDVIEYMCYIESEYKRVKSEYEKMVTKLQEAMKANNVKSWDCDVLKATIVPPSVSKSFDKDKFFMAHPELASEADKYVKETKKKESIRVIFRRA